MNKGNETNSMGTREAIVTATPVTLAEVSSDTNQLPRELVRAVREKGHSFVAWHQAMRHVKDIAKKEPEGPMAVYLDVIITILKQASTQVVDEIIISTKGNHVDVLFLEKRHEGKYFFLASIFSNQVDVNGESLEAKVDITTLVSNHSSELKKRLVVLENEGKGRSHAAIALRRELFVDESMDMMSELVGAALIEQMGGKVLDKHEGAGHTVTKIILALTTTKSAVELLVSEVDIVHPIADDEGISFGGAIADEIARCDLVADTADEVAGKEKEVRTPSAVPQVKKAGLKDFFSHLLEQ